MSSIPGAIRPTIRLAVRVPHPGRMGEGRTGRTPGLMRATPVSRWPRDLVPRMRGARRGSICRGRAWSPFALDCLRRVPIRRDAFLGEDPVDLGPILRG
jgi:hypothetical protein